MLWEGFYGYGLQRSMKFYAILCAYKNALIFLGGGIVHGFHTMIWKGNSFTWKILRINAFGIFSRGFPDSRAIIYSITSCATFPRKLLV